MKRAAKGKSRARAAGRSGSSRKRSPRTPLPPKQWTVMVWIAGDNNLEANGKQDLLEMKKVGSNADLNIVAQFDAMSDNHARRYFLRKGTSTSADQVEDLGPTNTGDPRVATAFFKWGIKYFPAQKYLAVLWNHGAGIDETDVYAGERSARTATGRTALVPRKAGRAGGGTGAMPAPLVRNALQRGFKRALFSTTLDTAFRSRAIAYDDTARDFLDNFEVRRVLEGVKAAIGRKVDVLGFDACLMNVAEMAYELREVAKVIVGSEEVEPLDGWPYDRVLGELARHPSMDGRALGQVVVAEYVKSYTSDSVTQSALDMGRSAALKDAVDALAGAMIAALPGNADYAAIAKALNSAQRFDIPDFMDLYDFSEQLAQRAQDQRIVQAARGVQQSLTGANPFVIASASKGARVARSHGVAIYYPRGQATLIYDRLGFARDTRWDEFIVAFTGQPIPTLPGRVRAAEGGRIGGGA